jgi:hypothetical protein
MPLKESECLTNHAGTSLQKVVIPLKKGIHAFFNYLKRMDFALCPTWPAFAGMTLRFFRDFLQWRHAGTACGYRAIARMSGDSAKINYSQTVKNTHASSFKGVMTYCSDVIAGTNHNRNW